MVYKFPSSPLFSSLPQSYGLFHFSPVLTECSPVKCGSEKEIYIYIKGDAKLVPTAMQREVHHRTKGGTALTTEE